MAIAAIFAGKAEATPALRTPLVAGAIKAYLLLGAARTTASAGKAIVQLAYRSPPDVTSLAQEAFSKILGLDKIGEVVAGTASDIAMKMVTEDACK